MPSRPWWPWPVKSCEVNFTLSWFKQFTRIPGLNWLSQTFKKVRAANLMISHWDLIVYTNIGAKTIYRTCLQVWEGSLTYYTRKCMRDTDYMHAHTHRHRVQKYTRIHTETWKASVNTQEALHTDTRWKSVKMALSSEQKILKRN